jgi:hypothetical protein
VTGKIALVTYSLRRFRATTQKLEHPLARQTAIFSLISSVAQVFIVAHSLSALGAHEANIGPPELVLGRGAGVPSPCGRNPWHRRAV